ncbi:DUF1566 domain-containing protein [bacterium]|nr:DUF1566 domain-containing protein [bacterium]
MQKPRIAFSPVLATVLLCLAATSCGGRASSVEASAAVDTAQSGMPAGFSLDAPAEILRGASAGNEDYLPLHLGSEFAAALPHNRCTVFADEAILEPAWGGETRTGDGLAYCIYRMQAAADSQSAVLELTWSGLPPAGGTCFIGLANWDSGRWQWQALPADDKLQLADMSSLADQSQHCLATVLLTGQTACVLAEISLSEPPAVLSYPIVDSGQDTSHDVNGQLVNPLPGQPFHGQDAQYDGLQPSYTDNGDGTITDNNTGLMWVQTPNNLQKVTYAQTAGIAAGLNTGGYTDWRVPTIKELYSLIDFRGKTGMSAADGVPYIDTSYFDFIYGDESQGERHIDAQYWSSTQYVSTTMDGAVTNFGVNFADGRIKGYGLTDPFNQPMRQFLRCVRGNPQYGINQFTDNGDGTITDEATGLDWMQLDSGSFDAGPRGDGTLNWQEALAWAENLEYAGHSDWRLPNAKELQSIVDYSRSPATTASAAIDPLFESTPIMDEGGSLDWAQYWSSTSHFDGQPELLGNRACYVCFGEGQGFMEVPPGSQQYQFWDVHGAGCQRSDLKDGDPADYPHGFGPQGDVQRIFNMVRCVSGGLLD